MAVLIRRVVLVANPVARRARRALAGAERALGEAGLEVRRCLTERPGHAAEIAADEVGRGDCDAMFVLGGDGTVMEVAGALSGSELPLAVLPGGTGNLLARALGIPFRPARAVPALLHGERRRIDLGILTTEGHPPRHFAIAGGIGIDSQMVARTPGWMKRRLGLFAYVLTASHHAVTSVLRRDFVHVRVTVDGHVVERDAALAMIANFGAVVNDRITFGPGIASDDGMLDACIYAPRSLRQAFAIMWRLLRKDFRSSTGVDYRSGSRIRIEATPPQRVQADGELLGFTPADAVVRPHAVTLLVPRR